jgi:RNA polymerase sigma factor (sigma-70 family)
MDMRDSSASHPAPPEVDSGVHRSRAEELRVRVEVAIQRVDDPEIRARIGPDLRGADPRALFALLLHRDRRVSTAAHECCVLRYAFIASAVARHLGMDPSTRDDLVQRTFVDLPQVVLRAASRGQVIDEPQGWLARRAHLVARQMRREELGERRRDRDSRRAGRVASEPAALTKGVRVPLDALTGEGPDGPSVKPAFGTTEHEIQEALLRAIELLAEEQPLWADILRWHYLEGFRLEEIARRLGRSHGTIRNDAMRARGRLAELLRRHFPHFAALMERNASGGESEAGKHAG